MRSSKSPSFSFMIKLRGTLLILVTFFFNSDATFLILYIYLCMKTYICFNSIKTMLQVIQQPIGSASVAQLSMWSLTLEKAEGIVFSILVSPLGLNNLFCFAVDIWCFKHIYKMSFMTQETYLCRKFIACFLHCCLLQGFTVCEAGLQTFLWFSCFTTCITNFSSLMHR